MALHSLGVEASPVQQMSCAPALVKMSLARAISPELSGVYRDQEIACLYLAFVAFGFDLRNPQTNESTGDTAHGPTDRRTA